MRLAPNERGVKARWAFLLLAGVLAVLLFLLVSAQTWGLTSVTVKRLALGTDGELNGTLTQLTAQIEELKGLVVAHREGMERELQAVRGQLDALQQSLQDSSRAAAAELASRGDQPKQSVTQGAAAEPDPQLQAEFERIYAGNIWGTEGKGSGSGSSPERTVGTREMLLKTITELKVRSMIDVPCGAMAWMPLVLDELERRQPGFRYLGLDIARPVIEANKATFRNKTNWKFDVKDMTREPLPKGYDLIHCRDALQHLSCPMIVNALHNFVLSGAKFLLVGSYDAGPNKNIAAGSYFDINLRLPPFSLSNPDAIFSEDTPGEINKLQLLYRLSEVAKADFAAMRRGCDDL